MLAKKGATHIFIRFPFIFQRTFGSNQAPRDLSSRYVNARSPCLRCPDARAQLCLLSKGLFPDAAAPRFPFCPGHSFAGASTHSRSSPSAAIPQQQFVRLWLRQFRGAIPRHGVGPVYLPSAPTAPGGTPRSPHTSHAGTPRAFPHLRIPADGRPSVPQNVVCRREYLPRFHVHPEAGPLASIAADVPGLRGNTQSCSKDRPGAAPLVLAGGRALG